MFRSADLLAPMRGGDGFGRRKNKVDAAVEYPNRGPCSVFCATLREWHRLLIRYRCALGATA